jgi:hypothetical protein
VPHLCAGEGVESPRCADGDAVNFFTGPLQVEYIDGKKWRVLEGFSYRVGDANGRTVVRVPRDFITDFASMPLGVIFKSPGGKWDKPAVLHDVLYWRGYVEHDMRQKKITRKEADDIFNEAMQVSGVNWFARQLIYAGVRVGGGAIWDRYRWVDGDVEKAREVGGL